MVEWCCRPSSLRFQIFRTRSWFPFLPSQVGRLSTIGAATKMTNSNHTFKALVAIVGRRACADQPVCLPTRLNIRASKDAHELFLVLVAVG